MFTYLLEFLEECSLSLGYSKIVKHLKTQMLSRKSAARFKTPTPLSSRPVQRTRLETVGGSAFLSAGRRALSALERSGVARDGWELGPTSSNAGGMLLIERVCWQCPPNCNSSGNSLVD